MKSINIIINTKTMSYNAGYEINLEGYDYETGTFTKTDEEMDKWYDRWINVKDRYFAFIIDATTNEVVGEVYFYNTPESNVYSMGILIFSENRGKGYSTKALVELKK